MHRYDEFLPALWTGDTQLLHLVPVDINEGWRFKQGIKITIAQLRRKLLRWLPRDAEDEDASMRESLGKEPPPVRGRIRDSPKPEFNKREDLEGFHHPFLSISNRPCSKRSTKRNHAIGS